MLMMLRLWIRTMKPGLAMIIIRKRKLYLLNPQTFATFFKSLMFSFSIFIQRLISYILGQYFSITLRVLNRQKMNKIQICLLTLGRMKNITITMISIMTILLTWKISQTMKTIRLERDIKTKESVSEFKKQKPKVKTGREKQVLFGGHQLNKLVSEGVKRRKMLKTQATLFDLVFECSNADNVS